jgi:hypothetical protein
MNETPVDYRERIFRTLGSSQPLDVLARTPVLLKEWMEQFDLEKWKQAKEEVWSPAQILAHLAEGELVSSYRTRIVSRSTGSSIQGYDQNEWVEDSRYLIDNPRLALKLFITVREANLEYISSLPAEAFERYGIHSERGKETLMDLIRMYAGHDLNHLRQIEQRLKS